jgi:hypothetical protein
VRAVDRERAAVALLLTLVVSCGDAAPASGTTSGGAAARTAASSPPPSLGTLLAAAKVQEYKITNKITVTGLAASALTGLAATAFSGEQTWYAKPPRLRFDFSAVVTSDGKPSVVSMYTLPEGSFICFVVAGQSQCIVSPAQGSPLEHNQAVLTQRAMLENPGRYGSTFTGSRSIAGQESLCYDVTATAGAFSKGTFCYTKEGIQTLSAFTAEGSTWSIEATSVSTTVPDSDLTLPAKPPGK